MFNKLRAIAVRKKFATKESGLSLAHGICFSVGLSMVLFVGPYLQLYTLSILTSSEASIYSAVYGDGFIQFPGISAWFNIQNSWPYFIASVIFVWFSRNRNTARQIFLFATIYFFVALTVIDVCLIIAGYDNNLFQCIIANIVGAVIVAACVLLMIVGVDLILCFNDKTNIIERILALAFPVAVGLIVNFIAYNTCALFFKLPPAKLDVILTQPISGHYTIADLSDNAGSNDGMKKDDKQFGIFSNGESFKGNLSFTSVKSPINFNWKNESNIDRFIANISFYSGCTSKSKAINDSDSLNGIYIDDLKSLDIKVDQGPVEFLADSTDGYSNVAMKNESTNMFWVKQESKDGLYDLSRYSSNANIDYWNFSGDINANINAILLKSNADISKFVSLAPRNVILIANGKNYDLNFNTDGAFDSNKKIKCTKIDASNIGQNVKTDFSGIKGMARISIKIERKTPANIRNLNQFFPLHITGPSGWVSVERLSGYDASKLTSKGLAKSISFQGQTKSFRLNNNLVESSPFNHFFVSKGNMIGELDSGGNLRFSGEANEFFKDRARVNQTRWEQLDSSIRLSLLSIVFTVFSTLFYYVINVIRKNSVLRFS